MNFRKNSKTKFESTTNYVRSNSAITLIALVITIIVLLILAAVSLNLVAGGDGILGKATTAVDTTRIATAQEQAELLLAELKTDYYEARYVNRVTTVETANAGAYIVSQIGTGKATNDCFVTVKDGRITVYTGNSAVEGKEITTGIITSDGKVAWDKENAGGSTPSEPENPEVAAKYTVTYNANGGTGAPTDSSEYEEGATVTVNFESVPTHAQATFLGWATTQSATEATYTSAGTKSFTMGTANATLYAVWQYTQAYHSQHPELHIPTGFAHTEGTVSEGYVIADSEGNEFVWIPVASSEDYAKKLGTNNWYMKAGSSGTDTGLTVETAVKGDDLGVSEILGETVTSTLDANQPEAELVNAAGGFWVGRYEAGVPRNGEHETIVGIAKGAYTESEVEEANDYWEDLKEEIGISAGLEPVRIITQEKALSIANNWKSGEASQGTVAFQSGLITGSRMGCNV